MIETRLRGPGKGARVHWAENALPVVWPASPGRGWRYEGGQLKGDVRCGRKIGPDWRRQVSQADWLTLPPLSVVSAAPVDCKECLAELDGLIERLTALREGRV